MIGWSWNFHPLLNHLMILFVHSLFLVINMHLGGPMITKGEGSILQKWILSLSRSLHFVSLRHVTFEGQNILLTRVDPSWASLMPFFAHPPHTHFAQFYPFDWIHIQFEPISGWSHHWIEIHSKFTPIPQ